MAAINLLDVVSLALQYGGQVKAIWDAATSNADATAKIKALSPSLATLLETLGKLAFPKAADALHVVGGIIAGFDPNVTKWLQAALNNLLTPSPNLVVDGIYGPRTTAAVQQLQEKLGIVPDGLAGTVTQGAISAALAKLTGK